MPDTPHTLLFILIASLVALLVVCVQLLRRPPHAGHFDRNAPPVPDVRERELSHAPDAASSVLYILTPREREVALLAARGLSNRQIAAELGLSINTVSNHLKRVYGKLNVHSRMELAWRLQYIDLNPDPDAATLDMGG